MQPITYKLIPILVLVICLTALFSLQFSDLNFPQWPDLALKTQNLGVVHIVMFEFKKDAKVEDVDDTLRRMLALKDQCLHPITRKPYLRAVEGGRNVSPGSLKSGITHGFVVRFESDEDRLYYLEQDPIHLAFVKSVGGMLEKAQRVDFLVGRF